MTATTLEVLKRSFPHLTNLKQRSLIMKKENETTSTIDNKEFTVAENEATATNLSAYVHKFDTPFVYEDKTYNELTFDWSKLTGNDSLAIENELQLLGKTLIVPEFSGEFLIRMAARACTPAISADTLMSIPMGDYNKIRSRARSFLMKSGS